MENPSIFQCEERLLRLLGLQKYCHSYQGIIEFSKIEIHDKLINFSKKLGYNSELKDLDRNLCELVNQMEGCNMKKAMRTILESLNADSRYCGVHSAYIL